MEWSSPLQALPIILGKVPGEPIMGSPGETPKVKDQTILPFFRPCYMAETAEQTNSQCGQIESTEPAVSQVGTNDPLPKGAVQAL
jgi:hypothetical protein